VAAGRAGLAALIALSLLVACSGDGSETTTGDTTTAGELVDGRHFGRVTALEPAEGQLAFDVADLDGDRVDDPDAVVVMLPIADDVEVRLLDPCCELSAASFEDWLDGFEPGERSFYTTSLSYYWLTLEGGEVVAVDEQYLPQ
jgi:hypothetical protein